MLIWCDVEMSSSLVWDMADSKQHGRNAALYVFLYSPGTAFGAPATRARTLLLNGKMAGEKDRVVAAAASFSVII